MNNVETQYDEAAADLAVHTADATNPHAVTASQTGAVAKAGDTMTGALKFDDANRYIDAVGSSVIEMTNRTGYSTFTSKWGAYITVNCYFDGTNWYRIDEAAAAYVLCITSYGPTYLYAAAGSGVISWTNYKVWNESNDGTGSTLDADTVDAIHFQVSGGVLQYDSGSGWVNVALQANTQEFGNLVQATAIANTWYTVCDISGAGVLNRVSAYGATIHHENIEVKITIDGTADTWDLAASNYAVLPFSDAVTDIFSMQFSAAKFDSTLKVEARQTSGGNVALHAAVDYGLV
jgi:hypothetical protein